MPFRTSLLAANALMADASGNFAISGALVAPLIIGSLALGVDYGNLTLQQRHLQQAADLAAISAAARLAEPEQAVASYLKDNGFDVPVRRGDRLLIGNLQIPFDVSSPPPNMAKVTTGEYTPDPDLPTEGRYVVKATGADSAQVTITRKADLYFASAFMQPPVLQARGTATAEKHAAFAIGSRIASLHDGILNKILTTLTGSKVELALMDYEALVTTDINVLDFIDILAIDLDMQAATYKDVLQSDIKLGRFVTTMNKLPGLSPRAKSALNTLGKALAKSPIEVRLSDTIDLGPNSAKTIGHAGDLVLELGLYDVISTALVAADGVHQVAHSMILSLPGLADSKLTLAIGEPMQASTSAAVGKAGSIVRTAQKRLSIEVKSTGLLSLAATEVRMPIYLELAQAEAKLTKITCQSGGEASVNMDVVPAIAELALGDVDMSAFTHFGTTPRVTKARLVDTPVIDIDATSQVNASNLSPRQVTFNTADIKNRTQKTVSTAQTLTSLQSSLLKKLSADIKVGPLSLATPQHLQVALADTLSMLTSQVDSIVYNALLTMGTNVGEAVVKVTDSGCHRPVLVQ